MGEGKQGIKLGKVGQKCDKCEMERSSLEERNKKSYCSYGATGLVSQICFYIYKKEG